MIEFQGDDYTLLFRKIRNVAPETGKALRKNLTAIGRPIADEVKRAALAQPSKSGQAQAHKKGVGDGLRKGIARAVELKILNTKKGSFSLRIRVSGTKFRAATGKPATLPRYYEGLSRKPWRHPLWVKQADMPGDGAWVVQRPNPFMLKVIVPNKHKVQEAVRKSFIEALQQAKITN